MSHFNYYFGSSLYRRGALAASAVTVATLLAACGGGSSVTGGTPAPPAPTACTPFTDSFGRPVSCADMQSLAGANLGFVDGGDGSGGAGDGGADGSGADGAPIANADLQFTDINGKTVSTKTDANGYYRISLRGLKAPLVATVLRADKPWKSMLVADIVRAPANRQFYTINLTGLTDVVSFEVAKKAGLSSADALTPAIVNQQKFAVAEVIATLNTTISTQISAAGLDPATFNPLTTAFVPNQTGYDKVLETTPIIRTSTGGTITGGTILAGTKFKFVVGDQWVYRNSTNYETKQVVAEVLGNTVSKLTRTLEGRSTSTVIFDADMNETASVLNSSFNYASNQYTVSFSCTSTPGALTESSTSTVKLIQGASISNTVQRRCISTTTGLPTTYDETSQDTQTFKFLRTEDIQTPAGLFKNARVLQHTRTISGTTYSGTLWVDPIMNRGVRYASDTGEIDELISFSIQNYPK